LAGTTFSNAHAQTVMDSTGRKIDSTVIQEAAIDSVVNLHSPRKASIRSAIIPGWGQIYNRSYWKLPIIYGALGTTAYVFFDNLKTYKELRFAYAARFKAALPNPASAPPGYTGPFQDSTDFKKLKSLYQNPYVQLNSIKYQRDEFRRYIDYAALVFALFWTLNIIDATVDAHLKSFDVSPDLGLRFKAGHSDMARTSGFSVVLYRK
jgi:hypothetical protein